jgi:hypothetical protein
MIMSFYSFAVVLIVLVSIVNAGEKVCPGYGFIRPPKDCKSTCSMENDECPFEKKCCFNMEQPCGFHCIVPKDNEPKIGKCPSPFSQVDNQYWMLCDGHFCDVDSECPSAEKCCSNFCGSSVCVHPVHNN